ncbi:type I-E CRISPR-associated protein Cas5/CasD [Cronobacter dublinensis]|uniref:type I-E CRISPR-associated protein Cas5/CasD n=1 Tax=Cronobacter dublinensis TaxID=413497 RepID=UPI000CFCE693|nr:type I-E CRISPR-associated protein Cas5/CasD [Cronobacter dublinensis]MDI7384999.1 type I-E CRISPR-associated protein Cas5/CasD [Cronobacter dublinensis]
MTEYLLLRLAGPMQSWGQTTFEGTRPTAGFPTRSGLLGLLAACAGVKRTDKTQLQRLSDALRFAVRCDQYVVEERPCSVYKMTDYHTVQDAREDYSGLKKHDTIQTWREYLCDAQFTVAVWQAGVDDLLAHLAQAVRKPHFTPYLGRRSCPLTQPLFQGLCQAPDPIQALGKVQPEEGIIYSEEKLNSDDRPVRVRDEPLYALPRQFGSRFWYVIHGGNHSVSE